MKIRPENYEHLWTDHDVNLIFTSCYLFDDFRKSDIVLIYKHTEKGLHFYLSKAQRKKFSKFGLHFFNNLFLDWEIKIKNNIKIGKKLIKATSKDKTKIAELSSKELKAKILERAGLFQGLGGNYFYTEYFFLDKIEKQKHKTKKLNNRLERMGKLKFQAREILNEFYNYNRMFRLYVEEAEKRTGRSDLEWLSFKEIASVLEGEKIPISNLGQKNWILAYTNKWKIMTGRQVNEIIKNFDNYFFNKKVVQIKGAIANKGIYRGKVKIIKTVFSDRIIDEIKKVKKGDVLVAETTGPDIMAACKKAGAIITDEGGITSHAAIVSRELQIPCIIGTKIATKVLHDGDLVEVDADKGIVKITKRIN